MTIRKFNKQATKHRTGSTQTNRPPGKLKKSVAWWPLLFIGNFVERFLPMVNQKIYKERLPIKTQKRLPNNPNVLVSDNGAPITSDGGNVLLGMFLNSPVVSTAFNDVTFSENRKNPLYSKLDILRQLIIQVIEGYRNDGIANYMNQDAEHRLAFGQDMAS